MAQVAVIGAGFVGLSCAYWLMRDGHSVTLYDAQGPGEGASYGNAGTFANYACIPVNNPDVFRNIPRFLFSSTSPLRIRWGDVPALELRRSLGVRFETLARSETAQLEPGLAPLFSQGTLFKGSVVADLVAMRAPSIDLAPYSPRRF